nr:disease resistance protein RPM1-like [Ipomoea batatas]
MLEDSDLVGIENPKHFLVSLLLDVDDDLRIHSVVRMGDLGKTTLVKKTYDDAQVINHFQLRVNILLGQRYIIVLDDIWDINVWMAI